MENAVETKELYQWISKQVKDPYWYDSIGIEDTLFGRFNVQVIHLFFVLEWLKKMNAAQQEIMDLWAMDLDNSLRVFGIGDLSVGPKVQELVSRAFGRFESLKKSFEEATSLSSYCEKNIPQKETFKIGLFEKRLKKLITYFDLTFTS